jgi:predicted transcriptional regulator
MSTKDEILRLNQEGKKVSEIATILGVSKANVSQTLKRNGIVTHGTLNYKLKQLYEKEHPEKVVAPTPAPKESVDTRAEANKELADALRSVTASLTAIKAYVTDTLSHAITDPRASLAKILDLCNGSPP